MAAPRPTTSRRSGVHWFKLWFKSDCKQRQRLNAMRYVLHRLPFKRRDLATIGAVDPLIVGRPSLVPASAKSC